MAVTQKRSAAIEERRVGIIAAAKKVFFDEGYQMASMDRIAAEAGTTKRTLYDHFGSKEALFSECIRVGCQAFTDQLPRAEDLPANPKKGLQVFLRKIAEVVSTAESIGFQRMIIAEAERHPEFGRLLYKAAFEGAEQIISEYLRLRVPGKSSSSHKTTARILLDVASGDIRNRALLGVAQSKDRIAELDQAIEWAVSRS